MYVPDGVCACMHVCVCRCLCVCVWYVLPMLRGLEQAPMRTGSNFKPPQCSHFCDQAEYLNYQTPLSGLERKLTHTHTKKSRNSEYCQVFFFTCQTVTVVCMGVLLVHSYCTAYSVFPPPPIITSPVLSSTDHAASYPPLLLVSLQSHTT